jgi:hypothetical protein
MHLHSIINVPTPLERLDAVNKAYVDDLIIGDYVTISTDETITGQKTFTATIIALNGIDISVLLILLVSLNISGPITATGNNTFRGLLHNMVYLFWSYVTGNMTLGGDLTNTEL